MDKLSLRLGFIKVIGLKTIIDRKYIVELRNEINDEIINSVYKLMNDIYNLQRRIQAGKISESVQAKQNDLKIEKEIKGLRVELEKIDTRKFIK